VGAGSPKAENPIQVDLIFQITFSRVMISTMLAQKKEGFYHDRYSTNMFFCFVIEVFGCFH